MIEIGRGGGKYLLTTFAGAFLGERGNPGLAMGSREMHEDIRLGLGSLLTIWMPACVRYICIRILLQWCIRMRLGHMLEIRGFLDKLLVAAGVLTDELEILDVLGLYMVIHRILLRSAFVTPLALELAGLQFGIVGLGHCVGNVGRFGELKKQERSQNRVWSFRSASIFSPVLMDSGPFRLQWLVGRCTRRCLSNKGRHRLALSV